MLFISVLQVLRSVIWFKKLCESQ